MQSGGVDGEGGHGDGDGEGGVDAVCRPGHQRSVQAGPNRRTVGIQINPQQCASHSDDTERFFRRLLILQLQPSLFADASVDSRSIFICGTGYGFWSAGLPYSSLGRVCCAKCPDIDLEYLHAFEKATARGRVAMPPESEWREVENI